MNRVPPVVGSGRKPVVKIKTPNIQSNNKDHFAHRSTETNLPSFAKDSSETPTSGLKKKKGFQNKRHHETVTALPGAGVMTSNSNKKSSDSDKNNNNNNNDNDMDEQQTDNDNDNDSDSDSDEAMLTPERLIQHLQQRIAQLESVVTDYQKLNVKQQNINSKHKKDGMCVCVCVCVCV